MGLKIGQIEHTSLQESRIDSGKRYTGARAMQRICLRDHPAYDRKAVNDMPAMRGPFPNFLSRDLLFKRAS